MAREQDTLNRPGASTATAAIPPGASSDEIRRNIDRTRAEMDSTVDALGNRLQPRHLLDEVLDYFKNKSGGSNANPGQTLRDGASTVLERVKDHPMPAVLIGAGLAWMLFEGDRKSRTRLAQWDRGGREGDIGNWRDLPEHSGSVVDARTGQPYDEARYGPRTGRSSETASGFGSMPTGVGGSSSASDESSSGPGMVAKAKEKLAAAGSAVGDAASSIGSRVSGAISAGGEAASGAAGSAAEYARGARGAIAGYGGSARDAAYGYGSSAYDAAGRGYGAASRGVATAMEEYPLISGVAALALGAVAGLLLPATQRENELMGEYSDEVKERAQQAGQQLYAGGKAVAQAATSAVTDATDESGMTPGSLKEKVRHVAQDVGQAVAQSAGQLVDDVKRVASDATAAATESARREGLQPGQLKETAKDVSTRAAQAAKDEAQRQVDQVR